MSALEGSNVPLLDATSSFAPPARASSLGSGAEVKVDAWAGDAMKSDSRLTLAFSSSLSGAWVETHRSRWTIIDVEAIPFVVIVFFFSSVSFTRDGFSFLFELLEDDRSVHRTCATFRIQGFSLTACLPRLFSPWFFLPATNCSNNQRSQWQLPSRQSRQSPLRARSRAPRASESGEWEELVPPIERATILIGDNLHSVKVFSQPHYTENFVQAILSSIPSPGAKGSTLVVGGDGRYFSIPAIQSIIRLCAGNGVSRLIIGQNGILSTPAVSHIIRSYKATGGILLTASHNPGGPDADFGIKYNMENGGPAPEGVTDKIYNVTTTISEYHTVEGDDVDVSKIGSTSFGSTKIDIIDPVKDYVEYLSKIFDFGLIKSFLQSGSFSVLFDALHGVTGPYGRALFVEQFGLPESSVQNCVPSPDFGGGHPDPNLTYAKSLVDAVESKGISFGAASDGDGDRNMIIGKGAFVNPSDSVAIIADWADRAIPYFSKGVKGLARSMPTSGAIDRVAKKKGFECFEVPTGWKFFGNLMDAGRLSICGEESFGTGSDHIREKDGLWAVVGEYDRMA